MTGPNYKPMPPRIVRDNFDDDGLADGIIRVDRNWSSGRTFSAEDSLYLSSIVVGEAICPPLVILRNTERARKILGLEPQS